MEEYRKRFEDRAFVRKVYGKRISELMAKLRKKHGITREVTSRGDIGHLPKPREAQLRLFA